MADARFEDAGAARLRLRACDQEDLSVISAVIQDAVFVGRETSWNPEQREFAVLLSRYRWEAEAEGGAGGGPERIRSLLRISDILRISAADLTAPGAPDVFSCLELRFTPGEDIAGGISLILSGDREVTMEVECIEVFLTDVTAPYPAASKAPPDHR